MNTGWTLSLPILAYSHMGSAWFLKTVVSALVHGVVYGMIYKIFRTLSLPEDMVLGMLVLITTFLIARRS
jgi:uncharacterized membrane protein YagU involved in acid resistance